MGKKLPSEVFGQLGQEEKDDIKNKKKKKWLSKVYGQLGQEEVDD